ncbi:response regulator [Roseomonas terrae]|jgi:signal transduction histidine kinase/CheY-like chemotaxis protein|uniref:histidine kinase n=1 Tax=Neoroseomonas terrae TaxID=424799 RepID=A0ABS5EDY6_9PROT|nr:response regulator [Neoroseomonas terrae]MBR0649231.1 response regulator [Neoroseomonas terrae]
MNLASTPRGQAVLHAVIGSTMAAVLIADMLLPLNVAVWVFYLLPMALAYLVWQPGIPILLAFLASVFTLIGFFFGPAGGDVAAVAVNRSFGIVTAWTIGVTGFFFVRNRIVVRRQEWMQAGQVALGQRMGGNQTLGELSANILAYLSDHLGAQAAAIFVRDGAGFERQATYGVPEPASLPGRVEEGGGLLREVVRDGRDMLVTDVPEGYLQVGSGLGRARPRSLLIAPMRVDDDINAVVEIGFLGDAHLDARAFLEQVSRSVGVALGAAMYRARLRELLEETQRQADELQQQSEELKSSNEELEEQGRALRESQAEMERQQAELEQTNVQLEEQTRILESQRDDLAHAQAALRMQARDLEQASRYKSEFVANMSHELRTPLNSLLILARLLSDNRGGNLTAEQVKYAQTIEASGNDLLLLINDILDISKIEAGRLELQPSRERIAPMMEKLAASFRALATEKGLEFRTEIAADAPTEIDTDAQRLEQVLKNFLSNALKFTEKGEVRLSVARRPQGRLAFTVRDTGIGIPAEQQQAIFEAFRQADGTINRRYGGTGLGLSISRELARLLGGHIEVESVPGEGSAFTFCLPEIYDPALAMDTSAPVVPPVMVLDAPASTARRAPLPATEIRTLPARAPAFEDDRTRLDRSGRTILVVEDDPAFSRILYDLAHERGFQCIVEGTADSGVEAAREFLPHAVILDIGLPDHTGLSVLDRIKRDTRTRHIPVHVVSVSDYAQTALSFGAVGYILKPVKREQLIQALERMDRRFTERVRRILVVEDNETQLESLKSLLSSAEVEVIGARTAAACLEELRRQTFDCLVLDLSLPDASGFEVLEQLNRDEDAAFPPVIVYTGRDLTLDEELRLRRHSRSIIIKGAKSPDRLLDEVTLFLHQVVSDLPDQSQRMLARSMNRDAAIEGRNILVVEDDVRNVFALTSIFEPHGATVTIARNGIEAIAALERAQRGETAPVDVVLMDVMMPEMDGLTAAREIRRRPEWKSLPIISLTAKARPEDQEQCLAAGANDYLAKPLDVDKLLSLVRVWMPR